MTAGFEAEARWADTFPKAGIGRQHLLDPSPPTLRLRALLAAMPCPVREVALKVEPERSGCISHLLPRAELPLEATPVLPEAWHTKAAFLSPFS